jgi:hypothetical protein
MRLGIAMNGSSWEDFIRSNILHFRTEYETLSQKMKELPKGNELLYVSSLNKPCQVVMIEFEKPYPTYFVVLHDKEHDDMQTAVLKNVDLADFSEKMLEENELLKTLGATEIRNLTSTIKKEMKSYVNTKFSWMRGNTARKDFSLYDFTGKDTKFKPTSLSLSEFAMQICRINLNEALRSENKQEIGKIVGDLKKDAETIQVDELRTKIVEKTERLEDKIEKLDKKLNEEVNGVRRIIGSAKEFQDFRVFTTDITDSKKSHIPREIFNVEINRLDDRIDKGLEVLNSRVSALSDIKEAYDTVLAQQNEFMKQQAEVMKQQSNFVTWIKYATVLVPIAVVLVPVIDLLLRHFLNIP